MVRGVFAVGCALSVAISGTAQAQTSAIRIDIKSEPLADALQALARQTGANLLFDRGQVEGRGSVALRGRLEPEAAVRALLAGTNLVVKRSASGALVIEAANAPPLARPDATVPELLVIGRRSQNADIRRDENDIQPYKVTTAQDLTDAHRDTLDDYFRSRITSNTQAVPNSLGAAGDTRSVIDLRGLGTGETLVLVDGRRLPSLSIGGVGGEQADINGIPLGAIKRVEILTGSAGGIYGFDALGGVVNVVLDHDTRGVEFRLTEGLTSRGDAHRQSLEARFGRTSADGRTDIALSASYSTSQPLLTGSRGYLVRDREATNALYPAFVLGGEPHGNGVGVYATSPGPLIFKPEYGGGVINSGYSFLTAGFSGGASQLAGALAPHGGQLNLGTWPGEADSSLGSWTPWSTSIFLNARHRFGDDLETYADAIVLSNRAEYRGGSSDLLSGGKLFILPSSPADPFTTPIDVTFPVAGTGNALSNRFDTRRYTVGVVSALPVGWRGTAEAAFGSFAQHVSGASTGFSGPTLLTGSADDPALNPFGNWNAFQSATAPYLIGGRGETAFKDELQEQSLRMAGPLFTTAGGPATLTLLVDRFAERVGHIVSATTNADGSVTTTTLAPASTVTVSAYAEFRARLFDETAPRLVRGLEVQIAARRDRRVDHFDNTLVLEQQYIKAAFSGSAYTAGAKVSPAQWLTLRGSYATAAQPPPRDYLSGAEFGISPIGLNDPRRGGVTFDFSDTSLFTVKIGGNADLKAVQAATLSLGAVVTPFGAMGMRFSADYSRIRRTQDVVYYTTDQVLAHEDVWPDRVVRAPLTDEDRAKGYTGGRVLVLDTSAANTGVLDVDTLDTRVAWPVSWRGGRLLFRADATFNLRNRASAVFQPAIEHVGYSTSPLPWRANAGVEWARGDLTLGANVQGYSRYLVYPASDQIGRGVSPEDATRLQGAAHIPAQAYVDLYINWRVPKALIEVPGGLEMDFGVVDLFDTAPPRLTAFQSSATTEAPGYSFYGDPRRRRFELALRARF